MDRRMRRKLDRDVKVLLILGIIAAVVILGASCFTYSLKTGSGTHECTVYAMEDSGLIWKTWTVWVTYSGQMTTNEDTYTVYPDNPAMVEQLRTAMVCHQRVYIDYDYYPVHAPWIGADNVITRITNVTG